MSYGSLTKHPYTPASFGMMRRLSDEMDHLFEGFGMPRAFGARRDDAWMPAMETFVRDGAFVLRADLPGLSEKDVTVEVAGDLLTLKGERKQEHEVKRDDYFATERTYGTFLRSLKLPDGAKGEGATATFKNGVLEVAVPMAKTPAVEETRKVAVTPG
jgi:HSP20 family protein